MAEATHSRVSADRIEDAIAKLSASQLAMNTKIDDLLQRMNQLEVGQQPPQSLSSSSVGQTPQMQSTYLLSLEFVFMLEMFKFHILNLLLEFSFVKTLFILLM